MASKGRNGDSMLVHMTPHEVQGLQALAMKHGGTLTINPDTGLPEANFLKSLLPILAGFALGPAGFGLVESALGAGAIVGGVTGIATGSLSKGLMAGLGAYGGFGIGQSLAAAGEGALSSQLTGEIAKDKAAEIASGQLGEEQVGKMVSERLADTSGFSKAGAGLGAITESGSTAMNFAKQNLMPLAAAASPIVADMMVPTTTKMPDISSNASIRQSIYDPYSGTYRQLNPVPAKNYGTPAYKPFADGGIVALAGGGDLNNIYANLGGKQVYDKISADYLKAGGTEAGLPSIFSAYDKPVAAPAAAAPIVTAAPDLNNIYANLGGKQVYDKIASDYIKAGGTEAGLPSILSQYDKPVATSAAATLTPQQQQAMALMFKSSTGGVDTAAMDALGGAAAVKKLAESAGYNGTATQLYDYANTHPGSIDLKSDAGQQLAMNNYIGNYTNDITSKFKTPAEQALELMYRSTMGGVPTAALDALGGSSTVKNLARSAGFEETPEWQQAYEKKMGYKVIPRMSTAESIAADRAASAAATSGLTALPRVDAGADTRLDYTGDGTSTVKPVAVKSTGTYNTVAGNTYVPPAVGTAVGQGTYQGQGTMASTGTQGPIVDFTGKSAFKTDPMTLAKQQIADQAAAKTAADKLKLDLYSQWGASNPKATELEHVNFIDKIGLPPETAAQLLNVSPDQAKDAYYNAKFNKQTGDSLAAYNYLMGKGANPTKSGVGEIMRPYSEATLGMPASTNRQYIFDQATGKYNRNPDYVAEYKDPSGGTNYLMSQNEIFNYFKKNAGQDDAATYAWAVENNLTPTQISQATGVPISQIAPKWRAAAANKAAVTVKNTDGTVNQEATDQKIADKAAADKAAADTAADKTVKDSWDEAAYLAANPDVAKELSTGKSVSGQPVKFKSGYEHYTMFGKDSGRQATTKKAAGGGMMGYAMGGYAVGGGLGSLGNYSDGGRLLKGPGDGVSDSIPATIGQKQQPARLADGEFVVPARIVSELGNGSTDAGAKKLYAMMDRVQRARGKTTGKNKVAANSRADKYLPA
jgi:hypothetical protein